MITVEGYYDIVWSEVNLEAIMEELAEFQNRYEITTNTNNPL